MSTRDSERARALRNLSPHAEARLAMALWSFEYAHEQKGGSMDFWDGLSAARKRLCIDVVSEILKANEQVGRAEASS